MWPVLFRLGPIDITSFGAMVAIGALTGLWVFRRELARSGLPDAAVDAAIFGLLGGLIGAKLLYVFEHLDESSFFSLLLDRGGMSWFGGFVGGLLAGYITIRRHGWPLAAVLAAATPALAVGQMLGRVGCFLVGDDYGKPTTLPWGVRFPARSSADRRPRPSDPVVRSRVSRASRLGADPVAASGPQRPGGPRTVSCSRGRVPVLSRVPSGQHARAGSVYGRSRVRGGCRHRRSGDRRLAARGGHVHRADLSTSSFGDEGPSCYRLRRTAFASFNGHLSPMQGASHRESSLSPPSRLHRV